MTTNIIRRYAVSGDISYPIHEDPEGDYVTYEDHVAAIERYQKRIEELESELQELQRQWVEHDTLGCPTAKTGTYAGEADRQRIADQFHKDGFYDGVILGLQAMAACGNAFNADYVELLRSAGVHETVKRAMKEGLYELAGLDSNASEDLRKEIDSTRKEFTQKIIYGST